MIPVLLFTSIDSDTGVEHRCSHSVSLVSEVSKVPGITGISRTQCEGCNAPIAPPVPTPLECSGRAGGRALVSTRGPLTPDPQGGVRFF